MKKAAGFLIFLILLLGLGAAVFMIGWVQFRVPPGSVGILRSKTHGIDPEPIEEGKFRWVWYRLIPTNTKIAVYRIRNQSGRFLAGGTLPQAEALAGFSGTDADFSWEISGNYRFSLKSSALPGIIRREGITDQAGLETLEARLSLEIRDFLTGRFAAHYAGYAESAAVSGAGNDAAAPSAERLAEEIAARFPDAGEIGLDFTVSKIPDTALYRRSRGLYEDWLDFQRKILSGPLEESAGRRMETRIRLEELSRYGELLTRYPVLLDYLSIENGGRNR